MHNKSKFIYPLYIIMLFLLSISCSSEHKGISRITKNLESQKEWVTDYHYYFEVADERLTVIETSSFKNGAFHQIQVFLTSSGQPLFKTICNGGFKVEYDSELSSFFLNLDYEDLPKIENLNTKDEWFEKFELEYRLNYHGDAYDVVEYNEDTLYGYQIIESTEDRLIYKDLEDMETYNYIPGNFEKKYKKLFPNANN